MTDRYDVIVIGSGAGGGTLAYTLATSGKKILLLERGDFLPRELANWDPMAVFVDGRYMSADTWYDGEGRPFQPQVHYFVGGATKMYGAALYRLRPADFGEIKYSDGISPEWPLDYTDLESYYTQAVNTARILLGSASAQHRAGLANGSDQVGRNFMFHNSKAVAALAREPNETVYQKTLGINDFYLATDDRPPLGNIQMLGKSNAGAIKGEEPKLTKLVPRWALDEVARHSVDFWLTTEDLPKSGNRVTLDGEGKVHLAYSFTNASETDGLYSELKTILNKTGLAAHHVLRKNFYMDMDVPIAGVAHQAGTCRFGRESSSSVADVNCKAHELDNLYLADASVFPSIGAVNPALTVMANAIRVGEHLAGRLG